MKEPEDFYKIAPGKKGTLSDGQGIEFSLHMF
jgi:hypothetical protein